MTTITQQFQQAGLVPWWNATVTQAFNGAGEKGTDFGLGSFNQPVGSLTGGKVVYVGDGGYPGSSIGQIVQVLTPNGDLIHYQHLYSSNVVLGQNIQIGTVIGHGGGCPVNCYPANFTGNSCTCTDQYSTGQHIEVRYATGYDASKGVWSQNWIRPLSTFQNLGNGTASGVLPATSGGGGTAQSSVGSAILPTQQASTFFTDIGQKVGLFLVALTLIGIGFYIAFSQQINNALSKGTKAAEEVA
jgi:hypothetical protein